MIDSHAKARLREDLRDTHDALLAKLDGLSDHDVRRALTRTGTNLLGLVKHLATWEARYLGEVFGRPFPDPLPRWDDESARSADLWAAEHESRSDVLALHHRVRAHTDTTIDTLPLDAPGHVPWWPSPTVTLFDVLVHLLTETSRHAGHADILREQLDGVTDTAPEKDDDFWRAHRATIDHAARVTSDGSPG
ncbi:DinB family protein [Actinosynnema sp. NPDC020468]|uniref:DinB family protein n=1 Tax=Actinosynnema sp. NPDC020468 TaxID=3154488 RepID=UPI0033C987E5